MQEEKWYQSRRVWSSIAALIAVGLPLFGYKDFNAESFTNAALSAVEALSLGASIILPVISWFKPKK